MRLSIFEENGVKIKAYKAKIPEHAPIFYNPKMAFDRKISVEIVKLLKPKEILDGLCATGIRGLLYAKNLPNALVILNDIDKRAIALAKRNAELNKIKNVEFYNEDVNKLLNEKKFDFIDIDPFGSPAYFLDSAAKAIRNNGIIAFTATDVATLANTYPKTCERRYGIKLFRTDFEKEVAVRVLLSFAMKVFSKYEIALQPMLCYYAMHYVRCYCLAKRSGKALDKLYKKFDFFSYCPKCLYRKEGIEKICHNCGNKMLIGERIYLGKYFDLSICKKLKDNLKGSEQGKLLDIICNEMDVPFYYDTHKLCKIYKKSPKKIDYFIEKIKASRTHFCSTGIKTKESYSEIIKIL